MQTFNPYSQPMMNNPYQNYGQTMQNPYMTQMSQYQPQIQPQTQQQVQGLVCKPVVDASNVSPNDVPMDGNAAVFPKNDFSEIYVKSWTPNGTIQTIVYKPVQPENTVEATNIPQMDFSALNENVRALREDIKGVREIIEKSMNTPTPKATSSRTKKGADEE